MNKKKTDTVSKPRNHVALAMVKRGGAGAHRVSNKALRRQEKIALHKETGKVSFFMGAFCLKGGFSRQADTR